VTHLEGEPGLQRSTAAREIHSIVARPMVPRQHPITVSREIRGRGREGVAEGVAVTDHQHPCVILHLLERRQRQAE
jgi:hypothetical protein